MNKQRRQSAFRHTRRHKKDKEHGEKFMPSTPLSLYASTIKILKEYLKNYKNSEDINLYKELGEDILSLLYYFRLPEIRFKWIEQYKIEEKASNALKSEKSIRKGKDSKSTDEKRDSEELEEILKKIIAILYDLFEIIKKKIKN